MRYAIYFIALVFVASCNKSDHPKVEPSTFKKVYSQELSSDEIVPVYHLIFDEGLSEFEAQADFFVGVDAAARRDAPYYILSERESITLNGNRMFYDLVPNERHAYFYRKKLEDSDLNKEHSFVWKNWEGRQYEVPTKIPGFIKVRSFPKKISKNKGFEFSWKLDLAEPIAEISSVDLYFWEGDGSYRNLKKIGAVSLRGMDLVSVNKLVVRPEKLQEFNKGRLSFRLCYSKLHIKPDDTPVLGGSLSVVYCHSYLKADLTD